MRYKTENSQQRTVLYDWIRLFATVCVVIGHSWYLFSGTTFDKIFYGLPIVLSPVYDSWFFERYYALTEWVYTFHMPLFFILSGAVFALKPMGSFDTLFRKKARRLLVPYFVCGWLFMLPVKWLGGFYDKTSVVQAFQGFLSGVDAGHLWFLTALFWCILIFAACRKILERFRVESLWALVLLCGGIQIVCGARFPFVIPGLYPGLSEAESGLQYLFYFALGYAFEHLRRTQKPWETKTVVCVWAGLIALEAVNARVKVLNSFFMILAGALLVCLTAVLCDRAFPIAPTGHGGGLSSGICSISICSTTRWNISF